MKRIGFSILSLLVLLSSGIGQTVPNGGFELWESRILYEEPSSWTTGNMLSFLFDKIVASKTTDSYNGDYALRLDTRITDEIIPGFAFSNGMITEGNLDQGFQFDGGIPVSGTPTQLSGFFKYNIPFPDVGIIMIAFKKDGASVGQAIYPLLFSSSSYTQINIPISDLSDVPDSAFIAFATTNPDDPKMGGWIQVDSLWFSGIEDSIPNGNFESWEEAAYYEPAQWLTSNLFTYLFGGDTSASRTEDAYAGNYALRLESVETLVPDDDGIVQANMGYLMPYSEMVNLNESMPAFPVDFNPSALTGYYKFAPFQNDTALIMGILTDMNGTEYEASMPLVATDQYTEFTLNFQYPFDAIIKQVSIIANTSLYFDPMNTTQNLGESGSVLYLDELDLLNGCTGTETFAIDITRENSCGNDTAILSAGDGWGTVSWSTGDTTPQIQVVVSEPMEISALVTSAHSWCFYTDTIQLAPFDGCTSVCSPHSSAGIRVYPNPTEREIIVSMADDESGTAMLEIIAQSGQIVYRSQIKPENQHTPIDLGQLDPGIYFLKLTTVKKTYYKTLQIR